MMIPEQKIKELIEPPDLTEIGNRIDGIRKIMAAHGVRNYVCFSPDNIFYLTNFANFIHERPFILVIPETGNLKFIVPRLELSHVTRRSIGKIDLLAYEEYPAPHGKTWKDLFHQSLRPSQSTGVETSCPLFLAESIPGTRIALDIIEDLRMVKSAYEVGRIQYASKMVSRAMEDLLSMADPGMGMLNVHSALTKKMMLKLLLDVPNTNFLATRISVAVQPPGLSDDPHNFTNIMEMEMDRGGPHVAIINCVINGYATEVERTFFLGEVPENARRPFEVMMEGRRIAMENCIAGNNMAEIDTRVKEHFGKAGYGDNILHRTGHSIGVTGHEGPFLAEGYDLEILPGMFFTIEPGIYIEGIGGFRHSDTVLVTEQGNISLTPVADSLESMTLPVSKLPFHRFLSKYRQPIMKSYARLKGIKLYR